jgi:hypothetical protein
MVFVGFSPMINPTATAGVLKIHIAARDFVKAWIISPRSGCYRDGAIRLNNSELNASLLTGSVLSVRTLSLSAPGEVSNPLRLGILLIFFLRMLV